MKEYIVKIEDKVVVDIMVRAGVVISKREAIRLIKQGAVKLFFEEDKCINQQI